jgi:hypothetical protein
MATPMPVPLSCPRTPWHGHFSKLDHLTKPSRCWTPRCILEPSQASIRLCIVFVSLPRPCSDKRRSDEHLAGVQSTTSSRANRAPPDMKPRQLPCIALPYPLAQSRLLLLSFPSCPTHRPHRPIIA